MLTFQNSHIAAWSIIATAWPLLVELVICMIALGFAVHAGWRMHRRQPLAGLLCSQDGTATMEFVLVFPIVLGLVLVLIQTTLVMAGNSFVHYAAFAATRSAVTTIPADEPTWSNEPRNQIVLHRGTGKFDRIRSAAVFALMPISGEHEQGDVNAAALESGLASYFQTHGAPTPEWVQTKAASRLRYADQNTSITFMGARASEAGVSFTPLSGAYTFGPRDPVTVRVAHRLNLSVPYARAIFADGSHDDGEGAYANVAAQYTLTNAGIDPSLPPEPVLPRRDQYERLPDP